MALWNFQKKSWKFITTANESVATIARFLQKKERDREMIDETNSKENIKFDLCEDCYKDLVAYISSNKNIKMRNERKEPYNELRYTPK